MPVTHSEQLAMDTESFVVSNSTYSSGRTLEIAAKRYRFSTPNSGHDRPGVILFLVHGIGFNKESWEPFLQDLEELQRTNPDRHTYVKEAWAYDAPNHGETAVINDKQLFSSSAAPIDIMLEDYVRAGLSILESGFVERTTGDRLVVIGHSVGTVAAVWLASMYLERGHLIDACILAEPPGELFSKTPVFKQNSEAFIPLTKNRRDIWPSKEEALAWFSTRRPWKIWDKRVLKTYVEYGLTPLPTGGYPDIFEGVTLSCHRMHEILAYSDHPELNKVIAKFSSVQKAIPLHIIVAERSFLRPKATVREELARTPGTSIYQIPKSDHLLVQEMPKELAQAVDGYLSKAAFRGDTVRSRL